ncbi:pseudouridine synthase [Nocardioides jiangxiensis]|uniref:RNA pseudouridylate synthase n=1 Tax=Nocardioides jiangxiensis TaxID=3064524 RepID=A0ABT9B1G2_9ACTN|nr:pseudouridine synthase [Nocardioides sp. WY-20]MDO7866988.1 pseudouridine synthase [Nocardioides sp. WY-20]
MPPPSPLPPRHGLSAAWVRTPAAGTAPEHEGTMRDWLRHRLPPRNLEATGVHALAELAVPLGDGQQPSVDVDAFLAAGRFVWQDGAPVRADDPYRPHTFMWFHRDLREEPVVPGELTLLHRDERIVVVDKPAFLSTIPRGSHVVQSVVVRAREELGLPELSPAHRLDRVTSGVLMLTAAKQWRGAYQGVFEDGTARKVYRAVAPYDPAREQPTWVRNHLQKPRGQWQGEVVPNAPVNAETLVELEARLDGDRAIYRLTPLTGRTHQLRMHLHGLGIPIEGDPLYPVATGVSVDDFSTPLQLLASELAFTDPVDGTERSFRSTKVLPL